VIDQVFEKHPAAEQFAADLKLLSSTETEERVRGCVRLGEAGSVAVRTLLERALADEKEVRHEAIWSVVRLADDLDGCSECDSSVISGLLSAARSHYDPFVRLCAEAARARQNGKSVAQVADTQLSLPFAASRESALQILERMVREEPERERNLEAVLLRASTSRVDSVRKGAGELLRVLKEVRSVRRAGRGPGALLRGPLAARRAAVEMIELDEVTAPKLLLAAISDPDRKIRRLASIKFLAYLRGGKSVELPESPELLSEETGRLFVVKDGLVALNPAMMSVLLETLRNGTAVGKQRVMPLIADLRPVVSKEEGELLDDMIRIGLRDKDREVRGHATAALRHSTADAVDVLTGRLRQHWQCESPRAFLCATAAQSVVFAAVLLLGKGALAFVAMMFTGTLIRIARYSLRGRNAPPVTEDEFYETLCALQPVAETRPTELRAALPHLRALSSRMGTRNPEVRAKARELLDKVNEATLHELPIAATAPRMEPAALPIPDAGPQQREVTGQ
jgi:hypothetical protein